MRSVWIAALSATLIVVFAGCHGEGFVGGGSNQDSKVWDGTVPSLNDRVAVAETVATGDATNAALPTAPVQGDQSFIDRMLGWDADFEDNAQWLIDELAWWVPRVNAAPNDAAGQIGMSIVLVYAGFYNAMDDIGLDPNNLPNLPDSISVPRLTQVGLESVTARDGAFAQLVGLLSTGKVGTAQDTDDDLWDGLVGAQTAIGDMIMPVLQNVMYRLSPLTQVGKDFALIPPTDFDGEQFSVFAAEAHAMCIAVETMMMVMDMYMTFDIDMRNDDLTLDVWEWYAKDANHDGVVAVGEYMPAQPALTMMDRGSWEHGVAVLRDMFRRASSAMNNLPTEPTALVNVFMADHGVSSNTALVWTDHIFRMLTGAVNVTVVHTWTPWPAGTVQVYTETDRVFPINIGAFLDNMPNDLRTIMPNLEYYLQFAEYDTTVNGADAGSDSFGIYEVVVGGGWEAQMNTDPMVPFNFNNRTAIFPDGSTVQFAADWQSFTGTTRSGDSLAGTIRHDLGPTMMYVFDLATWPDPTIAGLVPNPNAIIELNDAYHAADWEQFQHTWTVQCGPISFTDDLILQILFPAG